MGIEFEPVKEEQIPRRGKYRKEVQQWIDRLLKEFDKKGVKAIRSNDFEDRQLAMSYYDSFKDHVKKKELPIEVKIRKNNNGTAWNIYLLKVEE